MKKPQVKVSNGVNLSAGSLESFANCVIDECPSTNDLAKKLAEAGYPHGTWMSARRQSAGRGRWGRVWDSTEGNLFLSVIIRLENRAFWSWISLGAAIAVANVLKKLAPELPLRIKWPNDLGVLVEAKVEGKSDDQVTYEFKKLGGVLCEGTVSGENAYVVVGVGLNCESAPDLNILAEKENLILLPSSSGPVSSVNQATSLKECFQEVLQSNQKAYLSPHKDQQDSPFFLVDHLRGLLIQAILDQMLSLSQEGATSVEAPYRSFALLEPGAMIEWAQGAESGKVLGLGPSGELRIEDRKGQEQRLFAEEVRAIRKACGGSLV